MTDKAEIWFYHLEQDSLEKVLPDLLEKTLSRGWRALVRAGSQERLDSLTTHLWVFRADSFLPHGLAKDGFAEQQPVFLTTDSDNPNNADILFLVDGAEAGDVAGFKRCVRIFDGRDGDSLEHARAHWKQAVADGFDVTYWQQSAGGKWEKKT